MHALVVFGCELVAEEAGCGPDGLLDDPGALRDARDQLERGIALPVSPGQKPATHSQDTQSASALILRLLNYCRVQDARSFLIFR